MILRPFYLFGREYRGNDITTQQTTATKTSDLSGKFYVLGLKNKCQMKFCTQVIRTCLHKRLLLDFHLFA